MTTWKAWVDYEPEWDEYRIALVEFANRTDGMPLSIALQLGPRHDSVLKHLEPATIQPDEDRFYVRGDMLQALVDGCAKAGIVANSFSGDELKATKSHLEDMRAIAFHKVGANKP